MNDLREAIRRLQEEAEALPHGPTRVALLEEAVRHADVLQDVDLAYEVRFTLMTASTYSGRPDVTLVAFAWCLAQFDREPQRFNEHSLLWKYKWVIDEVRHFPEIDRARLGQLFADIERRYTAAGSTLHAVHQLRRDLLVASGDRDAAQAAHAAFQQCRRDSLSNCAACVASDTSCYYALLGQWHRAVQAAQPVLQGRLSCLEEPHRTLSRVLMPLLHLGQVEEARAFQQRGYALIRQANHFVEELAFQLQFVVLIGDLTQARRMVERHLAGILDSIMLDERFVFLLALRLWTDALTRQGTATIKMRLPEGVSSVDEEGRYEVRQLGEWFTDQAQAIARRFDARNGNDYFQQQIDELPELLRLARS